MAFRRSGGESGTGFPGVSSDLVRFFLTRLKKSHAAAAICLWRFRAQTRIDLSRRMHLARQFPSRLDRVMSSAKRFNETETESLPVEMLELGRLIDAMKGPERESIVQAYNRVSDSIHRRRRILNLVQEALSQLRLDVKYLMFDLETTRRERDQLQAQLEDGDKGSF